MRTATLALAFAASFTLAVGIAVLLPGILVTCSGLASPDPNIPAQNSATQNGANQTAEQVRVASPEPKSRRDVLPPCATIASDTAAADQAWAEKMFTSGLNKDFGTVPFGTQLSHRFKITNIYAAPVEITGFHTSCGCTQASASKRVLQPGESTNVVVTLDTREFKGLRNQNVYVGIGPDPSTACVLKISAVSQTDVVFQPDRVAFGTAIRGRTAVHRIDVEYTGSSPWTIEEVIIPKELPFKAALSKLDRKDGKIGYRLEVSLNNNNARLGEVRDYIYLKTNQPDTPPVAVLVTASVQDSELPPDLAR